MTPDVPIVEFFRRVIPILAEREFRNAADVLVHIHSEHFEKSVKMGLTQVSRSIVPYKAIPLVINFVADLLDMTEPVVPIPPAPISRTKMAPVELDPVDTVVPEFYDIPSTPPISSQTDQEKLFAETVQTEEAFVLTVDSVVTAYLMCCQPEEFVLTVDSVVEAFEKSRVPDPDFMCDRGVNRDRTWDPGVSDRGNSLAHPVNRVYDPGGQNDAPQPNRPSEDLLHRWVDPRFTYHRPRHRISGDLYSEIRAGEGRRIWGVF